MKKTNYDSGYIGKKDDMRESAKKLLKGDTNVPCMGSYPSASAPQFMKRRPYKKGGHVESAPRSKAAKMGSELHVPGLDKQKKMKLGPLESKKTGYLPQKADKLKAGGAVKSKIPAPVRAGTHPMIGEKKKSIALASGVKPKVNKSVKAKQSQPYDASKGMYLSRGGKVK